MKFKDLVIGMEVEIVSLDHTNIGGAEFKIGDIVVVGNLIEGVSGNNVNVVSDDYRTDWYLSSKDIEPAIKYDNPLKQHLGKEIEVVKTYMLCGGHKGMRGFVVSCDSQRLLVDFGDDFDGHAGHQEPKYYKRTCNYIGVDHVKFLQEDDE